MLRTASSNQFDLVRMTLASVRALALAGAILAFATGQVLAVSDRPVGDAGYADSDANIFLDDELTFVEVTMAPADLADLLANPYTDIYKTCSVHIYNSQIDETVTNVGIRPRGNTSRGSQKKSWKLSFNEFEPGRRFHGLKKLNLNGEHNDVSITRSKLAWDIYEQMGVPAPRAAHVHLTINDGASVDGIHVNVEQVNDDFVENWFGSDTGNLYKCLYQGARADLRYVSPGTPETYQYLGYNGDTQTYELETNEETPDYTGLANLINFINNTDNATFAAGIVDRFSVDNFLRSMAIDIANGHWDNYWYGANNFYLYDNPDTGRFEYIPYDLDNTYGVDFFGIDWANRSYSGWGNGGYGSSGGSLPPLIARILAIPAYEQQFRRYLRMLVDSTDGPFPLSARGTTIDAMYTRLAPYAFLGSYSGSTMDWGFDNGDFLFSYDFPSSYQSSNPWNWGIRPYINARAASLASGVPAPAALPKVYVNEMLAFNCTINTDEAGDYDDWVELYNDETTAVTLDGMYLSDDPGFPRKWQIPTGVSIPAKGFLLVWCDEEPTEGPLHASFKLSVGGEGVGIFDTDANGNVLIDYLGYTTLAGDVSYGRYPDGDANAEMFTNVTPLAANDNSGGPPPEPQPMPAIFINEWMADNDNVIEDPDEPGEYADYFELYNAEDYTVDLGGMHLTDDLSDPTQFEIPAGVLIGPKSFLIFWADDDTEQGPTHTNFKLGADGEEIGLYGSRADCLAEVDTISFGPQTTDVAEGRFADGKPCIKTLLMPTPGASNVLIPGDTDDDGDVDLSDYAAFADCLAGPGAEVDPGCNACVDADFDDDGDTDLADFAEFVRQFTGTSP